jgi:hypothetical protein
MLCNGLGVSRYTFVQRNIFLHISPMAGPENAGKYIRQKCSRTWATSTRDVGHSRRSGLGVPRGYVLELTRWSSPGKGERMRWLSELDLRHAPDPGDNVVVFVCSLRMCTAWRSDLHAQARRCCMNCLSLQVDSRVS